MNEKDFLKNQKYWGKDYFQYWKKLTSEAESKLHANDKTKNKTPDWAFYKSLINLLNIGNSDTVLEAGCGFGRSINYLSSISGNISCIDISQNMIQEAILNHKHLSNVEFTVGPIEKTQYDDSYFDKIICYGVFEAVIQEFALFEMARVLKLGGKVLITGKNYNYLIDDDEAKTAEINAKRKGHPNFFTHYTKMLDFAKSIGLSITDKIFFITRSDMISNKFQLTTPYGFYYYATVFEKTELIDTKQIADNLPSISSAESIHF